MALAFKFPILKSELLQKFKDRLLSIPREQTGKVVVVIDSIVSNPGLALPWEEMVGMCKEVGFMSIVDAAHSIGQEVGIDVKRSDPDFWVSVSLSNLDQTLEMSMLTKSAELSQVAFHEKRLLCIIRSHEVSYFKRPDSECSTGTQCCTRNQHFIRSSMPTSLSYASPNDPPGGPEPPNFIAQFNGQSF